MTDWIVWALLAAAAAMALDLIRSAMRGEFDAAGLRGWSLLCGSATLLLAALGAGLIAAGALWTCVAGSP